ncbi:MAG: trigger factor, partial [Opitutales bacterium]|nr:trigger factor [Opitutales bacterium]
RASYNPVEREVNLGDYVKVSYKGTIDGQDIAEMTDRKIWGTQENTWEEASEVGPNTLGVPAVIEGIVGMKAGDEKEVEQTFEDNHEVEGLRGKKGVYKVTVHEVRERVLPELNEDFLKSIQVESVEQLKERMKTEMTRRKQYERRMSQREQIARKLMEECQFEMPQSAIDHEAGVVLEQIIRENMQRGVPQEEFEKNKESLHANATEIATLQTKRNFIVGAIARKEKVEVTNEDLNRAIMNQAMRMRIRPEEIVKELQKNRESIRLMQRDILLDKTMEMLADKANVVESEDAPAEEGHEHSH